MIQDTIIFVLFIFLYGIIINYFTSTAIFIPLFAFGILISFYIFNKSISNYKTKLELLQNIQHVVDIHYMLFDHKHILVYSNKEPCYMNYSELINSLEKKFQNYDINKSVIHDLRNYRETTGLIQQKCDGRIFICEHKEMYLGKKFQRGNVIILKEIYNEKIFDIERKYKDLEAFLKYASFGLIYLDENDDVIGSNIVEIIFR